MKKLLLTLLLLCSLAHATISGSMIFEVSTAGSNSNGGCFKEGATGTDFTINAGKYNFTNLAIDATTNTKVTSASHNFVAADVGNCMRITAGTGFTTGVFEIVSVASNAATLDRSAGTLGSTSGTFFVGGPLLTLAQLNTDMCSGCRAYVHADGTYTTAALININFTNSGIAWWAGYTTTRGDGGKATIQASAALPSTYLIGLNSSGNFWLRNFILDINSKASTQCVFFNATEVSAQNIDCLNPNGGGSLFTWNSSNNRCVQCSVQGGTNASVAQFTLNGGASCFVCVVKGVGGNSAVGFILNNDNTCFYCGVDSLSGTTTDGIQVTSATGATISHCFVYSVTRDAIRITNSSSRAVINDCVFSTAINGINNSSGTTLRDGDTVNDYNFTYNMSGSVVSGLTAGSHSVTLSADPFTLAGSHDFTLNNTAGGGAAVRAAGFPNAMPGLTGTGYPDGGVLQHQDAGGGTSAGGSFVVAQ